MQDNFPWASIQSWWVFFDERSDLLLGEIEHGGSRHTYCYENVCSYMCLHISGDRIKIVIGRIFRKPKQNEKREEEARGKRSPWYLLDKILEVI